MGRVAQVLHEVQNFRVHADEQAAVGQQFNVVCVTRHVDRRSLADLAGRQVAIVDINPLLRSGGEVKRRAVGRRLMPFEPPILVSAG